ncbi:MAG: hypothetical protein IJ222_03320 [Bacteroidales bacterium]|nr:hypothetical protein [Bacteroidales bacterium]
MELLIDRKYKRDTYTVGNLYIDGVFFCNTLEDRDRGLDEQMDAIDISSLKIPGETAIPKGSYPVDMDTVSPKYAAIPWYRTLCEGKMPRLQKVKGFEGILIHPGSSATDSRGCILVGRNTVKGGLTQSRVTFAMLYAKMLAAHSEGEIITIDIQ